MVVLCDCMNIHIAGMHGWCQRQSLGMFQTEMEPLFFTRRSCEPEASYLSPDLTCRNQKLRDPLISEAEKIILLCPLPGMSWL